MFKNIPPTSALVQTMRRSLVLTLFSLALAGTAFAQKLQYGLTAGVNWASPTEDYESKIGFQVGGRAVYNFASPERGAFLDGSVLFSVMRYKSPGYYDGTNAYVFHYNSSSIVIPIHLGYKLPVAKSLSVFGSAGVYLGIGLDGSIKRDVEAPTGTTSNYVTKSIFGDDYQKRFDFGVGIKAGVEYKSKYRIALGYDWGLTDKATDKNPVKSKNRILSISATYLF